MLSKNYNLPKSTKDIISQFHEKAHSLNGSDVSQGEIDIELNDSFRSEELDLFVDERRQIDIMMNNPSTRVFKIQSYNLKKNTN